MTIGGARKAMCVRSVSSIDPTDIAFYPSLATAGASISNALSVKSGIHQRVRAVLDTNKPLGGRFFYSATPEEYKNSMNEHDICLPNLRTVIIDDEKYVSIYDHISTVLKVNNPRQLYTDQRVIHASEFQVFNIKNLQFPGPRQRPTPVIKITHLRAFTEMCISARRMSLSEKRKILQNDNFIPLRKYIESEIESVIRDSFTDQDIISQFRVGSYKVDFYFKNSNLVVECDEHNHSSYDKKAESIREKYIQESLGCKIIRFNPHDPLFNIQELVCKIRHELESLDFCVGTDEDEDEVEDETGLSHSEMYILRSHWATLRDTQQHISIESNATSSQRSFYEIDCRFICDEMKRSLDEFAERKCVYIIPFVINGVNYIKYGKSDDVVHCVIDHLKELPESRIHSVVATSDMEKLELKFKIRMLCRKQHICVDFNNMGTFELLHGISCDDAYKILCELNHGIENKDWMEHERIMTELRIVEKDKEFESKYRIKDLETKDNELELKKFELETDFKNRELEIKSKEKEQIVKLLASCITNDPTQTQYYVDIFQKLLVIN